MYEQTTARSSQTYSNPLFCRAGHTTPHPIRVTLHKIPIHSLSNKHPPPHHPPPSPRSALRLPDNLLGSRSPLHTPLAPIPLTNLPHNLFSTPSSPQENYAVLHPLSMTVQKLPPSIGEVSAAAAAALLSAHPAPILLDARPSSAHNFEHIAGALSNPPANLLAGKTVLVYDAGAPSLSYTSSLSAAAIATYATSDVPPQNLLLIKGGFPAVREVAPHLVRLGGSIRELRRRLRGMRWAMCLLERVEWEAGPPGRVLDWLWVGAERHAGEEGGLSRAGFTHVLVAGGELKMRFPKRFCYFMVGARDVAAYDIKKYFPRVVRFLEGVRRRVDRGLGGRCLVHCFAGASRSVALVIAYLVWRGMNVDGALQRVRESRKAAEPNDGFLRQLREWEVEVRDGKYCMLGPDIIGVRMPGEQAGKAEEEYEDDDSYDDEDYDEDEDGGLVVEEYLEREDVKPMMMPTEVPEGGMEAMTEDSSLLQQGGKKLARQGERATDVDEDLRTALQAPGKGNLVQSSEIKPPTSESMLYRSVPLPLKPSVLHPNWTTGMSDSEKGGDARYFEDVYGECGDYLLGENRNAFQSVVVVSGERRQMQG